MRALASDSHSTQARRLRERLLPIIPINGPFAETARSQATRTRGTVFTFQGVVRIDMNDATLSNSSTINIDTYTYRLLHRVLSREINSATPASRHKFCRPDLS